jgi:FAD binding domain-containing protein
MPATPDEPFLQDAGAEPWANKHSTYQQQVRRQWNLWRPTGAPTPDRYNATTRRLQRLLADARQQQVRVRAYGGGWSFSGAPATDGWLVNTKPTDYRFRMSPSFVESSYAPGPDGLRFVQCGNTVTFLNRWLRDEGRSLRTCGASNGQTIVGAMSTGTHGSALDVGSVQDYVRGIHLVTGPDRHVYLEPASLPVASPAFAQRIGAPLMRNDALFRAALVNLGGLGIVHGVLIETDPLFLLHRQRMKYGLDSALRQAIRTLDVSGLPFPPGVTRPFHFDIVMNPYDVARGTWVTVMTKEPYIDGYTPPATPAGGLAPGDTLISVMGRLFDVMGDAIPAAMTALLNMQFHAGDVIGTLGEIFGDTTTEGKAAGASFGLAADRAEQALDVVLSTMGGGGPYPCLVALRFVKGTTATLGFTRFPETCIIDLDGPLSTRTRDCYQRVRAALTAAQIPFTQHWGKIVDLNAADVRTCYGPAAVESWKDARNQLLAPEERRAFSNAFLEGLGLA